MAVYDTDGSELKLVELIWTNEWVESVRKEEDTAKK